MRSLLALATLLALVAPSARAQLTDDQARDLGRTYVRWFVDGVADSLAARMTPEALARVNGTAGLRERSGLFHENVGQETALLGEEIRRTGEVVVYVRRVSVSVLPVPFRMQWELDAEGRIVRGEFSSEDP